VADDNRERGRLIALDDPQIWIVCPRCGKETYHTVRAHYERSGFIDGPDIGWTEKHQIVQCDGCGEVSYRKATSNSEDFVYNQFSGELEHLEKENLFPKRSEGRISLAHDFEVPQGVRDLHREVVTAALEEQRVLVGIGIRALVESICKERGASGGNLEQKIDGLVTLGVLTEDGAEILHGTRLLGNEAAHEAKPLSDESIDAALKVVEHLLQTTYILPTLANRLPKRGGRP
jgi:ribosomal protein L37E